MRVVLLVALLAVIAFATAKTEKPKQLKKFDPKVFAKCLADKLGINLDKAVGCALQCKTDVKCYPSCLGVDDKKKVIVAAIECALAAKKARKAAKLAKKGTKAPKTKKPKTKKPKTGKPTKKSGKKSQTKKVLAKMMNKKVSEKKKEAAKKSIKKIFKRLVNKAKKQAKIAKLPMKAQLAIVKDKLAKRTQILKKILSKVTIPSKKDDGEKKVLKKMLREFAAKDMLKVAMQKRILNKVTKARKGKKGSKKPKTKRPMTKKPKKAAKKAAKKGVIAMSEGPYCDRCNDACARVPAEFAETRAKCLASCKPVCDRSLSDSEFLGKFGKWLKSKGKEALKAAGKAALGAAKDAAIGAITA